MDPLAGKIAWVTGAGSGIGEAAAVALAREGVTVVLTGRRQQPLEEVVALITAASGKAVARSGDMTNAATVRTIAEAICFEFGAARHPREQCRHQYPGIAAGRS